jgi:hypothetical protein
LGVPGMVLHAVTGCHAVLSDKESLIEQLRSNIQSNFDKSDKRVQALSLDWSADGVRKLLQTVQLDSFDVVLNCDCIYEPLYGDSWKCLLACQEELLRRNPDCYMLTAVERRRVDGVERYLQAAEESPVVSRVERLDAPFAHPPEVELYRLVGKRQGG